MNRRLSLLEYSDLPGHFPTFQGSSGKEMGLAITFIPIRISGYATFINYLSRRTEQHEGKTHGKPESSKYIQNIRSTGHFTFWISPSLSGIAERNCCNSQGSRSNYHVLKYLLLLLS